MDFRELPRVNLQDLIDGGYEPVIAHEGPDAFIVMAPPDGAANRVLDGVAELAGQAPTRTFSGPEEVAAYQMQEHGDGQQFSTMRQRTGVQTRGRPSTPPALQPTFPGSSSTQTSPGTVAPYTDGQDGLQFAPKPDQKLGMGSESGEIRNHPRVDLAQGRGVGLGAPVSGIGNELGSAVPSPFTSWVRREYNKDLYGIKGLRIYDKMRKSDGTVRGTMRLAKTPVLAGQWSMKPASQSPQDKKVANFVWKNLTKWTTSSWPQTLTEALLMLDFGYYMFEKVFIPGEQITNDPDAKGKIVWQKLAPRHPMDVKEWFFDYEGGPLSVDLWAPPAMLPGLQGGVFQGYEQWVNVPINKLLVFSFDKEAGNIEGISLLRSAYKHWYYKDNLYKIDAIQKERHGIGVPVVQLPVGYSPQDLQLADSLGRNLRTNDRAHVVLPPNWTLAFAELKGQPVDCIASINHHDTQIEKQILGQFLTTDQKTDEQDQTLFLKATRFTADIVVDTFNSYAIPQLCDMNWAGIEPPTLVAKRIGEQEDWRTASFTIRNYVGSGVIVPDQPLEDAIRDELGLPPADPATSRLIRSTENRNVAQPNPSELAGNPADIEQALKDGQITQQQYETMINQAPPPGAPAAPAPPKVGGPRQSAPGTVTPSTGRGDNSGTSGRRGQ
jgi:hypothetical protein